MMNLVAEWVIIHSPSTARRSQGPSIFREVLISWFLPSIPRNAVKSETARHTEGDLTQVTRCNLSLD